MEINRIIHLTESQYKHLGQEVKQALKGDIHPDHLAVLMKGIKDPEQLWEGYKYNIPLINMIRFMEAFTGEEYRPWEPE